MIGANSLPKMKKHMSFLYSKKTDNLSIVHRLLIVFSMLLFATANLCATNDPLSADDKTLENQFVNIPDSQRIAVYWYWISDNISIEGVQHDLEAMKAAGITRAYIGNIWDNNVPAGNIKMLTPEWWDVMHAALKRATDLDIEIGLFNCPGWSQSGGPWIKPNQAMRYLTATETKVIGNGKVQSIVLPSAREEAQDVCVLAIPAREENSSSITIIRHAGQNPQVEEIHFESPMTLRNVTIAPDGYILMDIKVQVRRNNGWEDIKSARLDRTNSSLTVGFHPYAPISLCIPDVEGQDFRLWMDGGGRDCTFKVTFSDQPYVERYEEKSLGKMFQSIVAPWDEYMWETQPEPIVHALSEKRSSTKSREKLIPLPQDVVELTEKISDDRTLRWKVPDGEWKVIRLEMIPTGTKNCPASPEATGYEVDKMSRKHVAAHFNAFLGELIRRIPEEDRRSFRIVVEDSYETGGQNWTDDMKEVFIERYGYDPTPFLPALKGYVIGSQDQSERFLWDLRRLIADRVAYDYVGGLRDISHEHGLTTWLECYGNWGFPSEFLMYGGQSDEVAGEFWIEGTGEAESRDASSCAHIYGKQKVWAESCTAGVPNYHNYPATMKQRTDLFFCEGINATLLHLFIQQPDDTTLPGISAEFGSDFQRKNTWWTQMDLFTDYLRRCNLMLQQGSYVADVAYFIGEDAPKMTGVCDPPLPHGYSFDYINAEVLMKSTVIDRRLTLPSGMQYHVLVLPRQNTMRPEVLQQLARLVRAGLNVIGPMPERSPSMQNYPACDKEVSTLAQVMWGAGQYDQGHVWPDGTSLQEVLDALRVKPDCLIPDTAYTAFIHRHLENKDIYFLSNQCTKIRRFDGQFRIRNKKPMLWHPVTGEQRPLPLFAERNGSTTIPLVLAPYESIFIVFEDSKLQKEGSRSKPAEGFGTNFAEKEIPTEWKGPWKVTFDSNMRGPEKPQNWNTLSSWTESENDAIRYYSGTAVYENTLMVKKQPIGKTYLDLGKVMVMARVYVNDTYAGGVWTNPYRVEVSNLLKRGKNTVRVEVVNNWQNRLIGDQQLPEEERPTWTSVNTWDADSPLQPSGLLGPVTLVGY